MSLLLPGILAKRCCLPASPGATPPPPRPSRPRPPTQRMTFCERPRPGLCPPHGAGGDPGAPLSWVPGKIPRKVPCFPRPVRCRRAAPPTPHPRGPARFPRAAVSSPRRAPASASPSFRNLDDTLPSSVSVVCAVWWVCSLWSAGRPTLPRALVTPGNGAYCAPAGCLAPSEGGSAAGADRQAPAGCRSLPRNPRATERNPCATEGRGSLSPQDTASVGFICLSHADRPCLCFLCHEPPTRSTSGPRTTSTSRRPRRCRHSGPLLRPHCPASFLVGLRAPQALTCAFVRTRRHGHPPRQPSTRITPVSSSARPTAPGFSANVCLL